MTQPVFLVETLAGVEVGDVIDVGGAEAHHAVAVRRMRVGESLVLTDGQGSTGTGRVSHAGKGVLRVELASLSQVPQPQPAIWVAQALPKGDRGERAVELLTEIGVARILPWVAERSVVRWRGDRGEKSLARWRATARESSKQARRAWLAEISTQISTPELITVVDSVDLAVILHESAPAPLGSLEIPSTGVVLVVVGPEGGLTDDEVSAFHDAGGHVVGLGTEVLRTSTAGVAATAALLSRTGRWTRVPDPRSTS